MSRTLPRRLAATAALVALLVGASACGGSDTDDATADESPGATAAPEDTSTASDLPEQISDPGDDLLASPPQAAVFEGTDAELTWRLPASYEAEDSSGRQATSSDGDVTYSLTVGAKAGADRRAEADSYVSDSDGDVTSEVTELTVGETEMSVVTADTGDLGNRAFFFTPEGTETTYAVLFFSSTATADLLPERLPERLEELYQLLGSLEVDGRPL